MPRTRSQYTLSISRFNMSTMSDFELVLWMTVLSMLIYYSLKYITIELQPIFAIILPPIRALIFLVTALPWKFFGFVALNLFCLELDEAALLTWHTCLMVVQIRENILATIIGDEKHDRVIWAPWQPASLLTGLAYVARQNGLYLSVRTNTFIAGFVATAQWMAEE
ncbi:hypothetical protein EJ05DRAFT_232026 [Pseudovirgaria hyperparasitica]|uniref:Uncharacterized protein n=1 Tax=Pseudovirgaria hyperparasitica TaxID=470096 RepID=A0A6A6VSV3_9PEZI|nr:uncharacterized protein EJ05DRAFT_232026 [Pseudovirgaria hyperparasitica]KAF2752959.1 hypothetical protein EJ05DRAFT_232026 [Pseudovirgaria hyperparasitica]